MAIEFKVETGQKSATSTSYASLDDFRQYWENRGVDYSATSDDTLKVKLNLATQYIDGLYNYQGYKSTTTQALEFPRDYLVDRNNIDWSGEIPQALINATCEAAHYSMSKDLYVNFDNVASKSIGTVSVTYSGGEQRPVKIQAVAKYLGDFTRQLRVYR